MRFGRTCWVGVCALLLTLSGVGPAVAAEKAAQRPAPAHPYGGDVFQSLVRDSARAIGSAGETGFGAWMDGRFLRLARGDSAGGDGENWADLLARHRRGLAAVEDREERARQEMALAVWLHSAVKQGIPNYNLERGFELANVAGREERQCLLQSVLISSLLQAMGVDAGIAMVYQNHDGQYTNNAHVVVLLKQANGRDALVDGSYRQTLVAHKGLMAMLSGGGYRYVRPVYTPDYRAIVSYREAPSGAALSVSAVRPMDVPFMRSQFDFYRGERAAGGVLAERATADGLQRSARFLQSSLEHCPRNPLPAYYLGLVYEKQGRTGDAYRQILAARDLYRQAGWAPQNVAQALARLPK